MYSCSLKKQVEYTVQAKREGKIEKRPLRLTAWGHPYPLASSFVGSNELIGLVSLDYRLIGRLLMIQKDLALNTFPSMKRRSSEEYVMESEHH